MATTGITDMGAIMVIMDPTCHDMPATTTLATVPTTDMAGTMVGTHDHIHTTTKHRTQMQWKELRGTSNKRTGN